MPKQAAKGDAAIQKAANKRSQKKMELLVYYIPTNTRGFRIRKVLREIK